MVKVGIIGAGFVGRNHYNQYVKMQQRAPVVALCDKEAERRAGDWSAVKGNLGDKKGTKRDLGGIRPYVNWQDLVIDPEVELVDICAPTFLHRDMVLAALAAGKHVLCEKPMGLSVEECDEMLIAATAAKGRFMIAQCIRFWPEYIYLKQVFDDRQFGMLRSLELRRVAGLPDHSLNNWILDPRLSGGALLDLHIHDIDFAMYLLGKPLCLTAQGYERPGGGVDRIHAQWFYSKRRPVTQLVGAWDLPVGYPFNMGFTAVFDQAIVVFDMNPAKPLTVVRHTGESFRPELSTKEAYYAQIEHFVDCIEQQRNPTISTPRESRDAVAIALAEKESIMGGGTIAVR